MAGARRPGDFRLAFGRNTPNDPAVEELDELGEDEADSTRGRIYQGGIVRFDHSGFKHEVACGEALDHNGRRSLIADRVWNWHK
jgi:hypothetical protein